MDRTGLVRRALGRRSALGSVFTVVACAAPAESGGSERTGGAAAPITSGIPGTAYPEAAILNIYVGGAIVEGCSGSVIAPRVALTAGHCVYGYDGWDVLVPYNGGQKAHGSSGKTYDFNAAMPQDVDPTRHDIGLVFLDSPIRIPATDCPVLAQEALKDGTNVVNIGRIDNGQLSYTDLFVSPPTPITAYGPSGTYPFDYEAQLYIEQGDSGGPDEVPGSSPHEIVAVNSGAGSTEALARVDLLHSWIQQQVQAHGGGCTAAAAGDAGGSGGASSSNGGSSNEGGVTGGGQDAAGGNAALGWGDDAQQSAGSGCSVLAGEKGRDEPFALLGLGATAVVVERRRRRGSRCLLAGRK